LNTPTQTQTQTQTPTPTQTPTQNARSERKDTDASLAYERAKTDEAAQRRRAWSVRRLHSLAREQTDLDLHVERARADAALASRDDFLGVVSHDLRDLIHVIGMSAATISEEAGHGGRASGSLVGAERIQRAISRMARLIGDLVDVASIDAHKLAVRPVPTDAVAVLREAFETWEAHAETKGIALVSAADGQPPLMANLDAERALQVLGNLITNGLKFSKRGQAVTLGVEPIGDEVRFSVADTGAGIASGKVEAIFERFWQVGENDRRGLGLGLYISRCLVEAHGGRIWAESELGVGSRFYFTVPRAR
jgi:signal transduction histidine kinase